MAKKKNDEEVLATISAARDDFDLGATLREGPVMTGTVTVFTDKPTGAKLGGAEPYNDTSRGFAIPSVRTWGLTGKIVELSATEESKKENAKEIAALRKEVVALAEKLEETSITLTLQSVPPLIKKDAKRAARKEQGINGKLGPDDARWEGFVDEVDAQLLQRTVVEWVRAEDGIVRQGMSIENARSLKKYIEETEYAKIIAKLDELLYTRQIAERAVEDTDF